MAATDTANNPRVPKKAAPSLRPLALAAAAIVLAGLLFLPSRARTEDYTTAQGYIHAFNNGVSVYSGVFALNRDLNLKTSVYGRYTIDLINPDFGDLGGDGGDDDDGLARSSAVAAVSGASAAATGSGATDTRHDLTAGFTRVLPADFGVEGYYEFSHEEDYTSHTPTVTLKKDLFQKNTTLTLGYSRNFDTISGRFLDDSRDKDTDNYFFGVTQVLSPTTVAQAGYSRNVSRGEQTEGIRLVPVDGATAESCTDESATCLDENFPDSRTRQAWLVGVNHYFTGGLRGLLKRSSVHLKFRYYTDDWEIDSWTGEVFHYKYLSGDTVLRLNYRYYDQTAAFFVKEDYTSSDLLRSSSPQLVDLSTHLLGVKATHAIGGSGPGILGRTTIEGKYEFYSESIGVNAHILMGSIRIVY